jgi:hypothetical protein
LKFENPKGFWDKKMKEKIKISGEKRFVVKLFLILIILTAPTILVFSNIIVTSQETFNKTKQKSNKITKDIVREINVPLVGEKIWVEDIIVNEKFSHLKGFKQIGFTINYDNITIKSFDKEILISSEKSLKNRFRAQSIEVESIYEEVDTSFFNVDERPVKQTYILKNLLNANKIIKLNIVYEIDSDFVIWNGTEYTLTDEPVYFEAFEVTKEISPGLNETSLTSHTLYFGNNYYDFKDITNLDYTVSVYSLNNKNYINLEINQEIKNMDEFLIDPVIGWTSHTISNPQTSVSGNYVYATDIDNDSDIDVLGALYGEDRIVLYENNGSSPPGWTTHNITTSAKGATSVYAIDIDNDNDVDVVGASSHALTTEDLAWYENNGSSPPGWTTHIITSSLIGIAESVYATDIDNDSDIDVLSADSWLDQIVWWENNGSSPPGWTRHIITSSADYAMSVFAIDIDNDSDIDVLSASTYDDKIEWYENNGSSPPGWTSHTITTSADAAYSVYAIDLDIDSDIDVLSASRLDDKIAWYENNGSSPPGWTSHNITISADGSESVFASDIDNDGDIDVLGSSTNLVAWYENTGGSPLNWTAHHISSNSGSPSSVFASDIDNDNDMDALCGSYSEIAWYESDLNLIIQEIIPIQVVEDVDLVKDKTTLVRAVVNNTGSTNKNVTVKLYFEGSLEDSVNDTINAEQGENIDLWFVPNVAGSNKEIEVVVEAI